MTNQHFASNFLFGPATAPFQVEGGLHDLADYGVFADVPNSPFREPAGRGCEHELRFRDDIQLLAELGFNAYRFGVEWARVEPQQGRFDEAAIAHYRTVTAACREFGLAPVVTLHHFSSPRWLISLGGWESPEVPELFGRYADVVIAALGEFVLGSDDEIAGAVCTLNEVNTGSLNHRWFFGDALDIIGRESFSEEYRARLLDDVLEMRRSLPWAMASAERLGIDYQRFTPWTFAVSDAAVKVIIESHRAAVLSVRSRFSQLRVGLTMASQDIRAHDDSEIVLRATQFLCEFSEDRYLNELVSVPAGGDFVGVQAYTKTMVGVAPSGKIQVLEPPKGARLVQLGYEYAPDSLEVCIRRTQHITGLDILVAEFGIGTLDDDERIEYYKRGMSGVSRCLDDGVRVLGFMPWSAMDNYEWEHGYGPLFGLIAVNRETMDRTAKPSACFLGECAKSQQLQ